MKQKFLRNTLLMFAAVGMVTVPTKAFAHQVQTNYILNDQPDAQDLTVQNGVERQGNSLEIQSVFSNGQPLKGAKVSIYAPERPLSPYATGMTDSQGRYSFKPNEAIKGEWEVKIERDGHSDILSVPVTDDGIDGEAVAAGPTEEIKDVHYASSPLIAVGSIAIAAACVAFARGQGKRNAE